MLFAQGAAHAFALDPHGEDWEGLSQLVQLAQTELGPERVVVSDHVALEELRPSDAIILIHPLRDVDPEELAAFMRAGGRVVLMDDYGRGEKLLAHFRIRRVPLPAHPTEMLRHNPAFAVAEPASGHAAVRDVERVVTNHGTGLFETGLSPLLVVHSTTEPDVLLAVAGVVGIGRFLAIGDASVAMNSMLRFPGNHALASAIVRYAAEDSTPDQKAGEPPGKVYLLSNEATITGQFIGAAAPLRDVRRLASEAFELLRRGLPPTAEYMLALLVGIAVVVGTTRRGGRPHRPVPPRYVRPVPVADQGGVAGHAAILVGVGGSVGGAADELKRAVTEQLCVRLRLDEPLSDDALVTAVRTHGLLGSVDATALSRLLSDLDGFDSNASRGPFASLREGARSQDQRRIAKLLAMGDRARDLLGAMDGARHGTIVRPT